MEQEKAEVEASIEHKKTDDYIDERARNDLNLVKPGEKVFVILGSKTSKNKESDQKSDKETANTRTTETPQENNLFKWYKLFF